MADFKTSDGVTIHYEVEGPQSGPWLLFSNSLGTNLHLWDGQVGEAIYRGFRVIRYDHRGHGQSEAPEGDYTIERLGKDVLDLIDHLELDKVSYCGLSMGGMTGVWLGREHPRRFTRLALCNCAVFMPNRDLWDGRIRTVKEKGMAAIADQVAERWFTPQFRDAHPDAVDPIRQMLLSTDPVGYVGCCAAVRDMDLRDRLGLVESPAAVVIGEHDTSTTPEQGQVLVDRIPGARKIALHAAHLSNIEARDDFNQAVFGFLTGERH